MAMMLQHPAGEPALTQAMDEIVRQDRLRKCYAAAMSRLHNRPADEFLKEIPWELGSGLRDNIPMNPPAENGLKSLVQLCIEQLDQAWEVQTEALNPERMHWDAEQLLMPTPMDHNKRACIVPIEPFAKRMRIC